MYLALFIYSAGRGLALPNWLAGPSYGVARACCSRRKQWAARASAPMLCPRPPTVSSGLPNVSSVGEARPNRLEASDD